MKQFITILFLGITTTLFSQQDYNTKKGYVAQGYDVVAYFNNTVIKGDKKFTTNHDGVKLKFSSKKNLELFNANPTKYLPQYGGYCAYAIGKNGEKVSINPKTYEIRDGKLYLFYNAWGTNTLKLWKKEGAIALKKQADKNWEKFRSKK